VLSLRLESQLEPLELLDLVHNHVSSQGVAFLA